MNSIKNKILIIGSSNTDMVIKTHKTPVPGETVLGGGFMMNPGGKGANQAVAAQRLGGTVTFVGKIGNDTFGEQALLSLKDEGIDCDYSLVNPELASGVAMITVDDKGENSIVVAPGANNSLTPVDCEPVLSTLKQFAVLLLQLEIPLKTVSHIAEIANKNGVKVILNPAPAQSLPDKLLQNLYLISPNESEAETLTGIQVKDKKSAQSAAEELKAKGVQVVVITMGAAGAFVLSNEYTGMVDSPKVKAIDTTAAGDTFNGALTVALCEGKPLQEAAQFACRAASRSVCKLGAQSSIPFRNELE